MTGPARQHASAAGTFGFGPGGDDHVLPFRTVSSGAQGRLVRLGASADEILARHDYPEPVSRVLGEALALTTLLGSLLQSNGRLILQTQTDGPLRQVAVNYTSADDGGVGHIR